MITVVHETTGRRVVVREDLVGHYTANGWKEEKDAGKPRGRPSVSRKKSDGGGDDQG